MRLDRRVYALSFFVTALTACSARGGSGGPILTVDAGDDTPATTGDATQPDVSVPDVSVFDDITVPDDISVPDVSVPDVSVPDVSVPDVSVPDVSVPDVSVPDVSTSGMNYVRVATSAMSVAACTLPGARFFLANQDDASATVIAPFDMRFFGLPTPAGTPLYISSNGFVSLMAFDTATSYTGTIPDPAAPNGVVAVYWADLVLGPQGVCVATVGTEPSRRFVVQWNGRFYSGNSSSPTAGTVSFQVVYNEADASIDFLYDTIAGQPAEAPTRAAVGIEDISGRGLGVCRGGHTSATPPARDCTEVTSGTRFRLVPAP